jgi:hypothetical protein
MCCRDLNNDLYMTGEGAVVSIQREIKKLIDGCERSIMGSWVPG